MRGLLRGLIVATVMLAPACGDDSSFSPTVENVSGTYHATTLTATQGNISTDLLALGATITMTLNANGTTEGRLLGPGLDEGGEDLDVDLAGTWTLADGIVTFDQQGDSFIPDLPFTAGENRLTTNGTAGPATIHLVLSK